MKEIVFCITTLSKGGAERVICNLANYFSELSNYKVSIISINKSPKAYDLDKKINIYYANDLSLKGRLKNILKRHYNFKKIIRDISPDVVISFLPVSVFLSLLYKNEFRYKSIISVRNDPRIEYGSKKNSILMRLLFPRADAIVFQTEEAKNYFNNIKVKNKKIIFNPVSSSFIDKMSKDKREKRIVTVGRLENQKNHEFLIHSFYEFQKKHDDYILEIYGDGTNRSKLEEIIKNYNLSDKVFLRGQVKDVVSSIKKASLFILSSDYEGMPNALVEAMVLGLPVISTDCPCGGPKAIIDSYKNGILVPIGDKKQMVNAMEYILESDEKISNFSNEASKIIKFVSPDLINKQWLNLVEEVTKNEIT